MQYETEIKSKSLQKRIEFKYIRKFVMPDREMKSWKLLQYGKKSCILFTKVLTSIGDKIKEKIIVESYQWEQTKICLKRWRFFLLRSVAASKLLRTNCGCLSQQIILCWVKSVLVKASCPAILFGLNFFVNTNA